MKKLAAVSVIALFLSACGIDVKTPKEMGLKVDLDAKGLAQQIRQSSTKKIPPQYQKFLKAEELKNYLKKTAKNLNGECLIPTRSMAIGEQQGQQYTFWIAQKCYVTQESNGQTRMLRVEFEISGFIDTSNLKYEFVFEEHPDAVITEVPREEYDNLNVQGRFFPKN